MSQFELTLVAWLITALMILATNTLLQRHYTQRFNTLIQRFLDAVRTDRDQYRRDLGNVCQARDHTWNGDR